MYGYEKLEFSQEEVAHLLSLIDNNNTTTTTTEDTENNTNVEFIDISEICDELMFIDPFNI
jgi:hypothetical protein